MKVLHVTDDLEGVSGVRSYLLGVRSLLADHDIASDLWSPPWPRQPWSSNLSRWASRHYARAFAARLEDDPPDVVHAHNVWLRLSPTPLQAAHVRSIPVVMTVHDYHLVCPRKWMIASDDAPCSTGFSGRCLVGACRGSREGVHWLPYNALRWLKVALHRRLLARWVSTFVCPSRHLASWMQRSFESDRIVHIANFADPPPQPALPPDPTGNVLYAGRLSREKGVDVLVRAIARLIPELPGVTLTVAGDGPETTNLQRLTDALKLQKNVDFVGRLEPEQLETAYRRAVVCVLPTLWMENCPVAVLEALARARAVVATRLGGVPELVDDTTTGHLFERGNVLELAHKLADVIQDPERAREMGAAAHTSWQQHYTPERHGTALRTLYTKLLERQQPAP